MGTRNIRLGSMLSFDESKEKDIVAFIEELNSRHKTGQFLSNLIRIALDNPEILETKDGKYKKGTVVKMMDKIGMSYDRNKFMSETTKSLKDISNKVNKIYDMSYNMYLLAEAGNRLGIEDKSKNSLCACFLLEKQLRDIQSTLDIELNTSKSNKLDDIEKRAEDVMELIINSYSSLIDELQSKVISITNHTENNVDVPVDLGTYNQQIVSTADIDEDIPIDLGPDKQESDKIEDETVDFGLENVPTLLDFFGNT